MKRGVQTSTSPAAIWAAATLIAFQASGSIATASTGPARSACEQEIAAVDQAVKLRDGGKEAPAEKLLIPVLAKQPNDFRANFVMGTVQLQRGGKHKAAGLNYLLKSEMLLPSQPAGCASKMGWYSVYNVIGVEYYREGDLNKADHYFHLADAHFADLFKKTQRDVKSNLGLVAFARGDFSGAISAYQVAEKLGDQQAKEKIATITKLQGGMPKQAKGR